MTNLPDLLNTVHTAPDSVAKYRAAEQIVNYFWDTSPVTEDGLLEMGFVEHYAGHWQLYTRGYRFEMWELSKLVIHENDSIYVPIHTIGQLRRLVSSLSQGE